MVGVSRRCLVCGSLLAAGGSRSRARAANQPDPARTMLPQPGDLLVAADSGNETNPLRPADLKKGDDPLLAWAFDPRRKVPRDGTRLNQVLLMRFDPATLGRTERTRALDGVVAYSAICTHQGCTVTDWLKAKQVLQCPCHQSQYDPRHAAKVVGGPAPRALPALPLETSGSLLVVAAPFTDRIGGQQQAT
jgi:rieske iron-sulfur protein